MRLQPSLELLNLWKGATLRAFPLLVLNQNAGSCRSRCSDLFSARWELYARRWGALRGFRRGRCGRFQASDATDHLGPPIPLVAESCPETCHVIICYVFFSFCTTSTQHPKKDLARLGSRPCAAVLICK